LSDNSELASGNEPAAVRLTPHIGAFVLETLTLGMYGEPRHTLREYVQNSFDSIGAAQRTRFLQERGRVNISFGADEISILDNGLGVPAAQAWKTLTSVGASKKDRQRDAGFRGIGRLAGMAYCDELIFRTTFPGETGITRVVFDCVKLLKAMSPDEGGDVELATLLGTAIKMSTEEAAARDEDHFFEVVLKGLAKAPDALTNAEKVRAYLSETVPVDFAEGWVHKESIESEYRSYFGTSLETIDVFVANGSETQRVLKPYSDEYSHAKGKMMLRKIDYFPGDDNRYWGWVGRLSESAAVTDWETRGLRVRVRNIQVDGTEIFEKLFTEVKPSYGRFSSYYVGEIHIDPDRVIPNARRDGFEETDEWISIKSSLMASICQPLASDAYEASQQGQIDVAKVVEDIDKLVARSTSLADNSRSSYDQVVDLMNTAKRLRRRTSSALKIVSDLDETAVAEGRPYQQRALALQEAARDVESVEAQARMLVGRFLGEEERLAGLRARIRQEVLEEVLDVVNAFVEPGVYQRIKRQLLKAG